MDSRTPGRACASWFLTFGILLLALPAAAQDTPLTEAEHAAWTAIGRVNTGGLAKRTGCTGTLIAADLVLTAAHCVPERARREEKPEAVHFVAGYFRDDYAAHRTAAEIYVHPGYVPGERAADRLHTDQALLVLDEPIPAEEVAPLPLAPIPGFADDVEILAYANRRPGALGRAGPCTAVALSPRLFGLTCPVWGGNSGAPLLRPGEDGWHVVAVAVARDTSDGAFRSYAVLPAPELFELAGREAP